MNSLYFKFFAASDATDKLGITWQEILFHAVALLALVIFLWIILFKPVKKMIHERREKTDEVFKANQQLKADSDRLKIETDELLAKAKQDAIVLATQASASAEEKARQIVEKAEQQATAILSIAHKESLVEQTRMKNQFEEKVADIVIELVSKVIGRELVEKDNDKFIAECLKEWEDN